MGYDIDMPPNQATYCNWKVALLAYSSKCSTYFIVAMTFERFYSIIRPHKAASFNTVKRCRIIIGSIAIVNAAYSLPHLFITSINGRTCLVYYNGMRYLAGRIYYFADQGVSFGLPFASLLIMNSVIIHTLCKRSKFIEKNSQGQCHNQGQGQDQIEVEDKHTKMKSSDKQIIIMLLSVTFSYLILMIPSLSMASYAAFVDYQSSPKLFAGFHLIFAIGEKTYFTNYSINFYLYVISGQKFSGDLLTLFRRLLKQ